MIIYIKNIIISIDKKKYVLIIIQTFNLSLKAFTLLLLIQHFVQLKNRKKF